MGNRGNLSRMRHYNATMGSIRQAAARGLATHWLLGLKEPITAGHRASVTPEVLHLSSPIFPRYPFTDKIEREDEQLGDLVVCCPG